MKIKWSPKREFGLIEFSAVGDFELESSVFRPDEMELEGRVLSCTRVTLLVKRRKEDKE